MYFPDPFSSLRISAKRFSVTGFVDLWFSFAGMIPVFYPAGMQVCWLYSCVLPGPPAKLHSLHPQNHFNERVVGIRICWI